MMIKQNVLMKYPTIDTFDPKDYSKGMKTEQLFDMIMVVFIQF